MKNRLGLQMLDMSIKWEKPQTIKSISIPVGTRKCGKAQVGGVGGFKILT